MFLIKHWVQSNRNIKMEGNEKNMNTIGRGEKTKKMTVTNQKQKVKTSPDKVKNMIVWIFGCKLLKYDETIFINDE